MSRFDNDLQNTVSIENSSSPTSRNIDKVHEPIQKFNFYSRITLSISVTLWTTHNQIVKISTFLTNLAIE